MVFTLEFGFYDSIWVAIIFAKKVSILSIKNYLHEIRKKRRIEDGKFLLLLTYRKSVLLETHEKKW